MSQNVEWARASSKPSIEADPDWSDPYGNKIDKGNVGVWLDEVMIEGTSAEFLELAANLIAIALRCDTAPELGETVR
jgi:hypothetical protein